MLRLLKVTGHSLAPDFQDGDFVLTSRLPVLLGRLRPGDVIVFQQPPYGRLIKRVACIEPASGAAHVTGLAAGSVDSRVFGAVARERIQGKVLWHIRGPHE